MEMADTVRVEAAVQYKARSWQSVEIDLGPGEAREVDLVVPAVPTITEMTCRSHACPLYQRFEQVAQKLHAWYWSATRGSRPDVLDIPLLDMLANSNISACGLRRSAFRRAHDPSLSSQCGASGGVAAGTGSLSAGAWLADDEGRGDRSGVRRHNPADCDR